MSKLNVVANIIDKVADRVDDFTLDKAEKAEMLAEINKAQLEVNKVEAGQIIKIEKLQISIFSSFFLYKK